MLNLVSWAAPLRVWSTFCSRLIVTLVLLLPRHFVVLTRDLVPSPIESAMAFVTMMVIGQQCFRACKLPSAAFCSAIRKNFLFVPASCRMWPAFSLGFKICGSFSSLRRGVP